MPAKMVDSFDYQSYRHKSEFRGTTVKVCIAFSPHSTSDWITENCHESETLTNDMYLRGEDSDS